MISHIEINLNKPDDKLEYIRGLVCGTRSGVFDTIATIKPTTEGKFFVTDSYIQGLSNQYVGPVINFDNITSVKYDGYSFRKVEVVIKGSSRIMRLSKQELRSKKIKNLLSEK